MYINEVVQKLEVSVIRQLAIKMKDYKDGINLTIGEPMDDVPEVIKEYMASKILNDKIGYSYPGGLIELRSKYAEFYNKYFEGDYTEKNCIVHVGATEAISSVFKTILKPGDEVILPLPTYPGYEPNVLLNYAIPVFIGEKENDYKITADYIKKFITPKTRAIVLTYPNNPTGDTLSLDEMDKIYELIKENEIYLICDEIYGSLVFGEFYSFARYKDLKDKIIILSGMSKSHSMTGYRIGFTLASDKFIAELLKVNQYTITGTNTVAQYGAIKALEELPERHDVAKKYKEKIDYLIEELNKLGFRCIEPKGAFYLYANYEKISNKKSLDFALDLIDKVQVGVVPSIAFKTEGAVRISVNKDMEILKEFIRRIKVYIEKYC